MTSSDDATTTLGAEIRIQRLAEDLVNGLGTVDPERSRGIAALIDDLGGRSIPAIPPLGGSPTAARWMLDADGRAAFCRALTLCRHASPRRRGDDLTFASPHIATAADAETRFDIMSLSIRDMTLVLKTRGGYVGTTREMPLAAMTAQPLLCGDRGGWRIRYAAVELPALAAGNYDLYYALEGVEDEDALRQTFRDMVEKEVGFSIPDAPDDVAQTRSTRHLRVSKPELVDSLRMIDGGRRTGINPVVDAMVTFEIAAFHPDGAIQGEHGLPIHGRAALRRVLAEATADDEYASVTIETSIAERLILDAKVRSADRRATLERACAIAETRIAGERPNGRAGDGRRTGTAG